MFRFLVPCLGPATEIVTSRGAAVKEIFHVAGPPDSPGDGIKRKILILNGTYETYGTYRTN